MPRPPQLAGVSPAAVYFASGGGVCRPATAPPVLIKTAALRFLDC
jgi:hypothetical protein